MIDKDKKRLVLLYFSFGRKEQFYAINDPLTKLIFSFNDIQIVLDKEDKINVIKFLFLSGETIHKILYDEEEIINIKYNNNIKSLSTHFYFDLLIKNYPDIIDYNYSI